MGEYHIRKATIDDVDAIAFLHTLSWRSAYRGLYPDSYLDGDLLTERKEAWKKKLSTVTKRQFTLVVQNSENKMVGFAAITDKPEHGYDVLLDNLHVHPDLKGKKLGTLLMKSVAEELQSAGLSSLYLWVLNGNTAATHFYLARGGRPEDESCVTINEKEIFRTRFGWKSFDALINESH